MFSNTEEPYDMLPKHVNLAITKLFYCFYRGAKNERNAKIAKISHFFRFSNLHNSLEGACNHIKLYTYIEKLHLEMCLETISIQLFQNTLNFFWCINNWSKWKIRYFSRNWHSRSPCATLWKFSEPNSSSSLMPSGQEKLGFLKTTNHRPTNYRPTNPPITYHLPTDLPTTYPRTTDRLLSTYVEIEDQILHMFCIL